MITANREELLSSLQAAQPGLSPKDIQEQSSCFVFDRGAIWTFNGEVFCRIPFKANGLTGAVNGEKLLSVLQLMQADEVGVSAEDGKLVVEEPGQRVSLAMESTVLMPITKMEKPEAWVRVGGEYSEALSMAVECAGGDKEKFATNCVHFHPDFVEAWDMKQMLRFTMETGVNSSTQVKRDGVKYVAAFGVSEVALTPAWLHFRNPAKHVMSCRRYVEEWLDLTGNLNVKGTPIQLPKKMLLQTDLAELFSSEDIDHNYARVQIKGGKYRIKSAGASGGYDGRGEIAYRGEPLSFYIAPKLLKQIVTKYNDAVVNESRLMVDGGKWKYIAVLAQMDEEN